LTQIARITGQIPDSVRTGHPRPKAVADSLKSFQAFLEDGKNQSSGGPDPLNPFAGLYDLAPLQVIVLSIGDVKATELVGNAFLRPEILSPRRVLMRASSGDVVQRAANEVSGRPDSYVDPLLLLAALSELTGNDPARDGRIAALLTETNTGWQGVMNDLKDQMRSTGLRVHLQKLLAGHLKARKHARKMLDMMDEKSKSQSLLDAVKSVAPELAHR
jgi:hypothetical protein